MKKYLLLLVAFLGFVPGFSQSTRIDSLQVLLKSAKTDTAKVMIMRDLITEYRDLANYDMAMQLVKQGIELSQKIDYKRGYAAIINTKGVILGIQGNRAEAVKLYLEALRINEKLGDQNGMTRNLNNLGHAYIRVGDYRSALDYLFRALAAADEYNRQNPATVLNPVALPNIITCFIYLKAFDSASFYAQKMYERGKLNNDHRYVANSLGMMANISLEKGEYRVAVEYGRAHLNLMEPSEVDSYPGWAFMANVYQKMQVWDSTIHYGRKAIRWYADHKASLYVADLAKLISTAYEEKKNPDSTLFYMKLAMVSKDSAEQRQKGAEIAQLLFNEKLREEEKAEALKLAEHRRQINLQYAGIALGLVVFSLLFIFLSHSIVANQRLIRFLGILALLFVFEFLNLFLHPYIGDLTHHSPLPMLGIMVGIAALLIPLHHKLEHWITDKLVEKNKRIRLAAAKKTIRQLEQEGV